MRTPPSRVTDACDRTTPFPDTAPGVLPARGPRQVGVTHRSFRAERAPRIALAVVGSDGTGRPGRTTEPADTTQDRVLTPAGR
ncbi:MAG TPA: hypothetical protein VMV92_35935 [Streptosporangiaceae bacterium]|nr:hypothetical protein [Streptosporangiaceae bacterium]